MTQLDTGPQAATQPDSRSLLAPPVKPYDGNSLYLGFGVSRSCGKCLRHRRSSGGKVLRGRGWCCADCVSQVKVPVAETGTPAMLATTSSALASEAAAQAA